MILRYVSSLPILLTTKEYLSKLGLMWRENSKECQKHNSNCSSHNVEDAPPLQKEAPMHRLEDLNQQQVELAFRLLNRLWEQEQDHLPEHKIPRCLRHLEEEEWQILGAALDALYEEKAQSSLH